MKTVKHLPIIDAKRPVTLVITKRDVTTADTKEPAHCVVAKACKRMMNAAEVRVHLSRTYVRANEGNWTRFFTPRSLRQEIIAFDRGGKFEPGQYQLGVIPKAKQSTGKRQGTQGSGKKRGRIRRYHVIKDVRTGPAFGTF